MDLGLAREEEIRLEPALIKVYPLHNYRAPKFAPDPAVFREGRKHSPRPPTARYGFQQMARIPGYRKARAR